MIIRLSTITSINFLAEILTHFHKKCLLIEPKIIITYQPGVMTILCVDLGTDMWPAVALSHEAAETNVMLRPPHVGQPLVSANMIRLVYGHIGLIEFAAGMFAYFVVMAEHGFYPGRLFGN